MMPNSNEPPKDPPQRSAPTGLILPTWPFTAWDDGGVNQNRINSRNLAGINIYHINIHIYIDTNKYAEYIYIYIYMYVGITCLTAPTQCFLYVHVSDTFPSSCARFTEVAQVSQNCARFTNPLIMFVFNCFGATKHILPILKNICTTDKIYIYIYVCIYIYAYGISIHLYIYDIIVNI